MSSRGPSLAALTAAFARRRCDVCGAPTRVICVGIDPAPDQNLCVGCAKWLVDNSEDETAA